MIEEGEGEGKKIFKCISNQKTNEYLKIISMVLNIKKNITCHVGRHTYATLFLSLGGKVEFLSKILGHNDLATTMIYVHIIDKDKVIMNSNFDKYFQ